MNLRLPKTGEWWTQHSTGKPYQVIRDNWSEVLLKAEDGEHKYVAWKYFLEGYVKVPAGD